MTIEEKVICVNQFIQSNAWLDFSVMGYSGENLVLHGGIDLTVSSQLQITFQGVLAYYGPFDWQTDTKKTAMDMPTGQEMRQLNEEYDIEIGYRLFRFFPEYHQKPILIAAESFAYDIKEVRYR